MIPGVFLEMFQALLITDHRKYVLMHDEGSFSNLNTFVPERWMDTKNGN